MNEFEILQNLLREKAELKSRLNLLPYDGTPEVKEMSSGKYLYIRKRIGNKVTSTYVGTYSDDLYNLLVKNAKESKELKKKIRLTDKKLAEIGYSEEELDSKVVLNLEFARSNMKQIIYDQAVLEGVSTTFPDTEAIIDNDS